jgi:hypothetical protein
MRESPGTGPHEGPMEGFRWMKSCVWVPWSEDPPAEHFQGIPSRITSPGDTSRSPVPGAPLHGTTLQGTLSRDDSRDPSGEPTKLATSWEPIRGDPLQCIPSGYTLQRNPSSWPLQGTPPGYPCSGPHPGYPLNGNRSREPFQGT